MNNLSDIIKILPSMKSGQELSAALEVLPEYDPDIRLADVPTRLMKLSDLYDVYVPSQMSLEIYSKLYLSLLHSLQKKGTKLAVQQRYENNKAIQRQAYGGILGGADSYTITGISGIGKSSAIMRSISLISGDGIVELDKPYCKIIPCLIVQCPYDSSVKGLLLEILRKADENLGTNYYGNAIKNRTSTVDVLIGTVSTIALNHIGLLIVDEIQNVVNSKNGKSLVGMLTQLINNSGISICMVGTNESTVFFEQAMQLARRSLGLQYNRLAYDQYFHDFCCTLYRYQYVKQKAEITPAVIEWLYEHSAGIISVVVSLVHDAQEIAILNGTEELNLEMLNEAYEKRLTLLHSYVEPAIKRNVQCKTAKKKSAAQSTIGNRISAIEASEEKMENNVSIRELVEDAKRNNLDIVRTLKLYMPVMEVEVAV